MLLKNDFEPATRGPHHQSGANLQTSSVMEGRPLGARVIPEKTPFGCLLPIGCANSLPQWGPSSRSLLGVLYLYMETPQTRKDTSQVKINDLQAATISFGEKGKIHTLFEY
ncbi:hypothetical protein CDAR_233511 [Caerostris darwini]|uniref:Uncharacterized protein n=1 Tax=Caerostris darwini TaxID=1538125 RepID=A0AAV4NF30_9ARAC|nr:hypothetical protein CDAR_233511 [Caerostris darwini]